MYRHVSGIDRIAIKKYHQRRRNEEPVEISYRHIPARGSPNADFNQQDNEEAAEISSRQANPRSRSRPDNHLRNIEANESRIRDSYRHVEGLHRDTIARFEGRYYSGRRNEGGDLYPGSSASREHFSYQVYNSTSRPARYRESNDNPSRGQVYRSETAPLPSYRQNNNPWLKDTFRSNSYQGGDSRGEQNTSFSSRQQAHHPRPSLETPYHYSPRAAYPHQDQGPYHSSRPAYSNQTDAREKESSHYYHTGLPRRPASRARARHVHQREEKSKSSRHGHSDEEEEEEDTYHSARHPREGKSYSSRHGNLDEEEDTYRSARHPRKEKSYSSHHGRSEEKYTYRSRHPREENFHHRHQAHSKEGDTYNDHQADSGGEEDTYCASPSYSQDSETHYARPSYARDSETSYYSQAHARKKEASHTHEAPRQEDQDRSKPRQAHSGAKGFFKTYREEIKSSPLRQPEPKLVGDLYKSLKVSPDASHDEIVHAARRRRIEVHPDRRKLPGMSPSDVSRINMEAQEVGLAADTLCDEASREKYDKALRRGLKT